MPSAARHDHAARDNPAYWGRRPPIGRISRPNPALIPTRQKKKKKEKKKKIDYALTAHADGQLEPRE